MFAFLPRIRGSLKAIERDGSKWDRRVNPDYCTLCFSEGKAALFALVRAKHTLSAVCTVCMERGNKKLEKSKQIIVSNPCLFF